MENASQKKPVTIPAGFDWQGHRGCRGLMPENTIPAFLHALEFPDVKTLELDLAVSKDGQLIVSHEPWFNHAICLDASGQPIAEEKEETLLIHQFTVTEIRAFDCGSIGNTRFPDQHKQRAWKPTLEEVVHAVKEKYPDREVFWNIEIKSKPEWDGVQTPPIDSFVALVVDNLKALGIEKNCNLQSFDIRPLQILKQTAPEIKLALLVENIWGLSSNLNKLGFQPDIYSPYHQLVSQGLVQKCHEKGIKVIPWTVNDTTTMTSMLGMGVDGIITDYPNLIQDIHKN